MARQRLSEPPRKAQSRTDLHNTVHGLGFVQVDSIGIVERAHHHILFSRNQTYRQRELHHLIERDRSLFENWTHDAAIIPSEFFPYWRHRFDRERERLRARWQRSFDMDRIDREVDVVLGRIAGEGPLRARDFDPRDKPSTGWWDWHPAKTALEYLWRTGVLSIARREAFQKVYDLTENVVPAEHLALRVDHEEFVDWACRSALHRLGFATRGEIAAFFGLISPAEAGEWLSRNGRDLVSLAVETVDGKSRPVFALAADFEAAGEPPDPPGRVRIVSPFDPLLRDRARAERLFGFSYRIEIFVPEEKRRYGYYVFPVMRGDEVIGRIDMKAERGEGRLAVRAYWPEEGRRVSKRLVAELEAEIERMRRFAGVEITTYADDWLVRQ